MLRRSPLLTQGALVLLVWLLWAVAMQHYQLWHLFADYAFMSVTMVVGSFIAGASSEGGGAVAFPVMTLLYGIAPHVARDFSLMIQSLGMTAASIAIVLFRIPVEWRAVMWGGVGGALGVILGLSLISPLLTAVYTKVFFLSLWLSFAVALYWINRDRAREVRERIAMRYPLHALSLLLIGFVGGVISGLVGSGLDILSFAVLVLFFGLNEKVATPTSVVLMASNSLIGFFWQGPITGHLNPEAWNYWWVCVPVVIVGAPLGARFIRDRSRHFIRHLLYGSIFVQYIGGLLIIPQSLSLLLYSAAVFSCGALLFWRLAKAGRSYSALR